jgi:hypothetical protein
MGTAFGTARIYVYGIVHADRSLPQDTTGVGRPAAPVRLLPVGELGAVVSTVPDDLRARRRDLLAHQDLLLELGTHAPVLPMRFGMVAPDARTVERAVREAADAYLIALERLDGHAEMNLKVSPAESGVEQLVVENSGLRRLAEDVRTHPSYEGSLRLGQSIAEGITRRAAEAAGELLARLRQLADGVVPGPEVPGCVLNASFLVPDEARTPFRNAVERFAAGQGQRVVVRMTGPLPCYSFVPQGAGVPASVSGARRRAGV